MGAIKDGAQLVPAPSIRKQVREVGFVAQHMSSHFVFSKNEHSPYIGLIYYTVSLGCEEGRTSALWAFLPEPTGNPYSYFRACLHDTYHVQPGNAIVQGTPTWLAT